MSKRAGTTGGWRLQWHNARVTTVSQYVNPEIVVYVKPLLGERQVRFQTVAWNPSLCPNWFGLDATQNAVYFKLERKALLPPLPSHAEEVREGGGMQVCRDSFIKYENMVSCYVWTGSIYATFYLERPPIMCCPALYSVPLWLLYGEKSYKPHSQQDSRSMLSLDTQKHKDREI